MKMRVEEVKLVDEDQVIAVLESPVVPGEALQVVQEVVQQLIRGQKLPLLKRLVVHGVHRVNRTLCQNFATWTSAPL
jgi:hypothetical protein